MQLTACLPAVPLHGPGEAAHEGDHSHQPQADGQALWWLRWEAMGTLEPVMGTLEPALGDGDALAEFQELVF